MPEPNPPDNPINHLIHELHQQHTDDDEPCPDWCPLTDE